MKKLLGLLFFLLVFLFYLPDAKAQLSPGQYRADVITALKFLEIAYRSDTSTTTKPGRIIMHPVTQEPYVSFESAPGVFPFKRVVTLPYFNSIIAPALLKADSIKVLQDSIIASYRGGVIIDRDTIKGKKIYAYGGLFEEFDKTISMGKPSYLPTPNFTGSRGIAGYSAVGPQWRLDSVQLSIYNKIIGTPTGLRTSGGSYQLLAMAKQLQPTASDPSTSPLIQANYAFTSALQINGNGYQNYKATTSRLSYQGISAHVMGLTFYPSQFNSDSVQFLTGDDPRAAATSIYSITDGQWTPNTLARRVKTYGYIASYIAGTIAKGFDTTQYKVDYVAGAGEGGGRIINHIGFWVGGDDVGGKRFGYIQQGTRPNWFATQVRIGPDSTDKGFALQVNGKASIDVMDSTAAAENIVWQDPITKELKKAAPGVLIPAIPDADSSGRGLINITEQWIKGNKNFITSVTTPSLVLDKQSDTEPNLSGSVVFKANGIINLGVIQGIYGGYAAPLTSVNTEFLSPDNGGIGHSWVFSDYTRAPLFVMSTNYGYNGPKNVSYVDLQINSGKSLLLGGPNYSVPLSYGAIGQSTITSERPVLSSDTYHLHFNRTLGEWERWNGTDWATLTTASSAPVTSIYGRTGAITAEAGDYSSFYASLSGSYSNPSWITGLAWSKITGAPSFITTETDPTIAAHIKSITGTEKLNWNTSFGWGNHASAGYLTNTTGDARYPQLSGSYSNPSWITGLAWSKITGAPSFIAESRFLDSLTNIREYVNTKDSIYLYHDPITDSMHFVVSYNGGGSDTSNGMFALSETLLDNSISRSKLSNPRQRWDIYEEFIASGFAGNFSSYSANSGGAFAVAATNVNHLGEAQVQTSTSANARGAIGSTENIIFNTSTYTFEVDDLNLNGLNNGTDSIQLYIGFFDGMNSDNSPVDGAYVRYDAGSANWQICTRNNSTETRQTTSSAVAASTNYRITCEVNNSSAKFYINGVQIGTTITTNIPQTVGRDVGIGVKIAKKGGTAYRAVNFDRFKFKIEP